MPNYLPVAFTKFSVTHFFPILYLSLLFTFCPSTSLFAQLYMDASAPVDDRIEDLISRMTIEEKIGQMTQLNITMINNEGDQSDVSLDPQKARELLQKHHIGSFLNGEAVSPNEWLEYITGLQRIAIEETRLGIPVIYGIDHMHGASYLKGSTIFPHNINIGATFNTENALQNGRITARESGPLGHTWNFAPVLDLGQNPYWARIYETYGEDPHLASELGQAYVRGLQAKQDLFPYQIAATGKHFVGYSVPRSGWDRTPVHLSMQNLHEFHLPAFQAAFDAGMKTIMVNSGELNGIPVHSSKELLTDLLRETMGFEGVIVTDWADIGKLYNYHRTARNYDEATLQVIEAGIDMSMTPTSLKFNESMIKLVNNGAITEERINESVYRILKLKFELGLFEHPYPSGKGLEEIGSDAHKAIALRSAQESMVLLKNENNLLPLSQTIDHILLVGPTANNKRNLAGGWTLSWQGGEEHQYPESMNTIAQALSMEFPDSKVTSMNLTGKDATASWEDFEAASKEADVIVVAAGEEPYTEFVGNITSLELPEEQLDLIRAVNSTGKPSVLVLVEGRPRVISDVVPETNAIIWAGLPGFEGADAIADVLSGEINPSGKLPFSYPQFVGYNVTYNHKASASYYFNSEAANDISQADDTIAEWEFGHGLSYTDFSYSHFMLNEESIESSDEITAAVRVTNTGSVAGTEVVLWFMKDEVGRISRPVKELIHFQRVELQAGESKELMLTIQPEQHLSYPNFDGDPILEKGYFQIQVGDQKGRFYLNSGNDTKLREE